jgi:hypothetical protein
VNWRGKRFATRLHAVLAMLPSATSISLNAFSAWELILIITSSDEAASEIGKELGLGAPTVERCEGRWWNRWASEAGTLRVTVTGPHHAGSPASDDVGEAGYGRHLHCDAAN